MVELRHLRYFLAIADCASFTRAAARLRITQPTLSHQIKQLERELGTPLFDRVGSTVRLTEHGSTFRGYAERALREVDSGMTALAEMNGRMHGQLTVGVYHSFGGSLLPGILSRFNERHRDVRLEVRELSRPEMERQLLSGELNLAVGYAPATDARVVCEPLFTEPLALIVGRQHPFYGRKRVRLKELDGQPLALLSKEFPSRQLIDRSLESSGVTPRVVMEMNSNEAILAMVRCSLLATLRAERTVSGTDDLHAVRLSGATLERTSAIFWSRNGYRTAAANALAAMIHSAYADYLPRAKRRARSRSPEKAAS